MPEGLRQGDTGQLLEERAEACEGKADEWEQNSSDIESIDTYDDKEAFLAEEGLDREEGETDENYDTRVEEAMKEKNSELRNEAADNIDTDLGI